MFDHERPFDTQRLGAQPEPGGMLNKVCGRLGNLTRGMNDAPVYSPPGILAESTYNALTVWWHRTGDTGATSDGFQLLWTAFRTPPVGQDCHQHIDGGTEYRCADGECIDADLVCDTLPHCTDATDTLADAQMARCGRRIPEGAYISSFNF
jgi:hypothetical protein